MDHVWATSVAKYSTHKVETANVLQVQDRPTWVTYVTPGEKDLCPFCTSPPAGGKEELNRVTTLVEVRNANNSIEGA